MAYNEFSRGVPFTMIGKNRTTGKQIGAVVVHAGPFMPAGCQGNGKVLARL